MKFKAYFLAVGASFKKSPSLPENKIKIQLKSKARWWAHPRLAKKKAIFG